MGIGDPVQGAGYTSAPSIEPVILEVLAQDATVDPRQVLRRASLKGSGVTGEREVLGETT
jgi:hypothetical protein